MDKILDVKNLSVSFRTSGGTVKAVRNISFELERGKTLAIVGESGSGKSVTSKAILGILAGNSIIESGEILYDGKDLLKISEEEMCDIRGNRISMIFQDPLSSLNPIVKIGRQITEAMLLKDKGNRRQAKKEFDYVLDLVKTNSINALGEGRKAEVEEKIKTFDNFNAAAIRMENAYNTASSTAEDIIAKTEDFLFLSSKKQKLDVKAFVKNLASRLPKTKNEFFSYGADDRVDAAAHELRASLQGFKPSPDHVVPENITAAVKNTEDLLRELKGRTAPDFFRIGYYQMRNPQSDLHQISVEELNEECRVYMDEEFMNDFLAMEEKGVAWSFGEALEKKKKVVETLRANRLAFTEGDMSKGAALKWAKELASEVEASIDRMEIVKDSSAYTFRYAMTDAIERYFNAVKRNPKEEARFERQSKRREALIARGRTVDWKVVPKTVYDLDELKNRITRTIDSMTEHYEDYIAKADSVDFSARSVQIVDYLKDRGSQMVHRVTLSMAREKAISLMEEVGIPEPRIRYNQYPFEFSGGMRQRIVIAIALAANPDILICDEPTTALDVTIQAQILELINKLKAERHLSVIFITHDLGVVANMADDIAVMYAGKIVEYGTADEIFYDPRHPYTWALLSSMPDLDTKEKLDAIPGTPPNMIYPPVGDAFAARNKYAMQIDFEAQPPAFPVSETHWAATWLLHPDAPKVEPPKIIVERIERMKKRAGGEAQ